MLSRRLILLTGAAATGGLVHFSPAAGNQTEAALILASVSQAATRVVPITIDLLRIENYRSPGDGGGGLYRRAATEPCHAGKLQTLDGAWWEMAPSQDGLDVRCFGASGSGQTSDVDAVKRALTAISAGISETLRFVSGVFLLDQEIGVSDLPRIKLVFVKATIVGGSTPIRSYFLFQSVKSIEIEDLAADQMARLLPAYTAGDYGNGVLQCVLYCVNVDSLSVTGGRFFDLYTSAIFFYRSGSLRLTDCQFLSATQRQAYWTQHLHIQTCHGAISLSGCVFDNAPPPGPSLGVCGLFCSGLTGSITIEDCSFNYCGRDNTYAHRLGVIDFYGDVKNVAVRRVKALNCMAQFMRLSACHTGLIEKVEIQVHPAAELDSSILSIESVPNFSPGNVGTRDVTVRGCSFADPSHRSATAIGVYAYDWGCPSTGVSLEANSFEGCRGQVAIRGPFVGIHISKSRARGASGQISLQPSPTPGLTEKIGPEQRSAYDDFLVQDVDMESVSGSAPAIDIALNSRTTAKVGHFVIAGSSFQSASPNSGAAVAVQLLSTNPSETHFDFINCEIRNYWTGLYPRDGGAVVLKNVHFFEVNRPVLNDGSNRSLTIS